MLLAIAYGLASGHQWWRFPPSEENGVPTLSNLAQIEQMIDEDKAMRPQVRFDGSTFTWVPLQGGDFESDTGRRIRIVIEPGADSGIIAWHTGKSEEQGDEHTCSSFVASVLMTLPDAVDDGAVTRMLAEQDERYVRREATRRAAYAAGVTTGAIYEQEGGDVIIHYCHNPVSFGWEPRCSWTLEGEQRQFAPFREELEDRIQETDPIPWETAPEYEEPKVIRRRRTLTTS